MKRKEFIRNTSVVGLGIGLMGGSSLANSKNPSSQNPYSFITLEQTPLAYGFAGLEPKIETEIMELHYTKHAAGYLKNLKTYLSDNNIAGDNLFALIQGNLPSDQLKNNLGGHFNHELFWRSMSPNTNKPVTQLQASVESNFGSFQEFLNLFNDSAAKVFGSGWAWLAMDKNRKLHVLTSANQNSPLMVGEKQFAYPIFGIDVWEHAYYLQYQNRRKDYILAWDDLINWDFASEMYLKLTDWLK